MNACASCVGDNEVLLVRAKAHELIMSAMRAHPQAEQLQEEACRALSNLAVNGHPHESRNFMSERAVVRDGGLWRVVVNACASCVGDNKVLLVKAGVRKLILSAMRAHPQAVQVQEWACHAFENLRLAPHLRVRN